jgi:predicted glycosyltransferase
VPAKLDMQIDYREPLVSLPRRARIALYSPGIVGLGHLRRNLLISQVLAESDLHPVNFLVTEAREASIFVNCMPPGMDCITLPGLSKGVDGVCKPRYLGLSLKQVLRLRSRTIKAALKEFNPDLLIVDNLPRGAYRELDSTLKKLKANGSTRLVLGLRDVLDEPAAVQRDWSRWKYQKRIETFYDAVWVYGDPRIYNMVEEYDFAPGVAEKVRFAGYLDQRKRMELAGHCEVNPAESYSLPDARLVLCLLGGGQDGDKLAEAFSQAQMPRDACGVIVTGPFMSVAARERLQRRAATNRRLRVLTFITEPTRLVERAERVVAMGGYNTVCEVLSFQKRALIVPRTKPRREQIIRAERLRDLGLLDLLQIEQLNPRAIEEWIARPLPPLQTRGKINLRGLDRLPAMAKDLLEQSPAEFAMA